MAKKPPDPPGYVDFIRELRAAGVLEYEGPLFGNVVVKLKLSAELVQPNPRAATPITDVTPKPAEVPKELAAAGVTPEQYTEHLALAAALNPLA
jgi:hypothetical protein